MLAKFLFLAFSSLAAAQRCQNYWNGRAPFCAPGGCASDAYKWWGIVSDKGDGSQCLTGMKRLCQCLAPGSLDACVPLSPPKESEHLNGLFTTCNNGCSVYVCSVKFVKFWKREERVRSTGGVHRRRFPCEEHPEQPHCNQPDPTEPTAPPPQPTNTISSKPLTPDQVHNAFWQIETGALAEILTSVGENTAGKSQSDLVDAAWNQFSASMGNLDIGQVNAYFSLGFFEQGPGSWIYYSDRIGGAP